MNKIYIVCDKDRVITAVFDNKKRLDWFLNGYEKDCIVDEYEANDTRGLRVLKVYDLALDPDSLDPIRYEVHKISTYIGYYRHNGTSESEEFIEVQADSLDEAINRVKECEWNEQLES